MSAPLPAHSGPENEEAGSDYKWIVVALLCAVGGLNYCDRTALSSVFPLLRTDLKMSDLELAATGSFFLWTYGFASPLSGHLGDRMSRSRLIVASLAGWSAVTLLTGFVTSVPQLLATRLALGFFEAAYLPAAMALIADHHPPRTRATALAIHTVGLNVGLVAGGAGSGYLGQHYGWKFGFVVLGAIGLVLAVVVRLFLRDSDSTQARRERRDPPAAIMASLVTLGRVPSYWIIVTACMVGAIGSNIFLNWFPLYFNEKFHLSLAGAGFAGAFALQSAAAMAGLPGGVFSDRIAARKPERRMLIEAVANLVATPFLLVFLLPDPRLLAVNVSIFLFSFAQKFGYSSVMPLVCDLLPPRLRATAFGLINAANCLVAGTAVFLTGFLKATWGLSYVFAAISVLTLLSGGIMLFGFGFFLKRDLARRAAAAESESAAALPSP